MKQLISQLHTLVAVRGILANKKRTRILFFCSVTYAPDHTNAQPACVSSTTITKGSLGEEVPHSNSSQSYYEIVAQRINSTNKSVCRLRMSVSRKEEDPPPSFLRLEGYIIGRSNQPGSEDWKIDFGASSDTRVSTTGYVVRSGSTPTES